MARAYAAPPSAPNVVYPGSHRNHVEQLLARLEGTCALLNDLDLPEEQLDRYERVLALSHQANVTSLRHEKETD